MCPSVAASVQEVMTSTATMTTWAGRSGGRRPSVWTLSSQLATRCCRSFIALCPPHSSVASRYEPPPPTGRSHDHQWGSRVSGLTGRSVIFKPTPVCLQEREENVKADVFHAYLSLLKQTRPAQSWLADPDAMEQGETPLTMLASQVITLHSDSLRNWWSGKTHFTCSLLIICARVDILRVYQREPMHRQPLFHAYLSLLKQTRPAQSWLADPDAMEQGETPLTMLASQVTDSSETDEVGKHNLPFLS